MRQDLQRVQRGVRRGHQRGLRQWQVPVHGLHAPTLRPTRPRRAVLPHDAQEGQDERPRPMRLVLPQQVAAAERACLEPLQDAASRRRDTSSAVARGELPAPGALRVLLEQPVPGPVHTPQEAEELGAGQSVDDGVRPAEEGDAVGSEFL